MKQFRIRLLDNGRYIAERKTHFLWLIRYWTSLHEDCYYYGCEPRTYATEGTAKYAIKQYCNELKAEAELEHAAINYKPKYITCEDFK